jgi:hypothetical protein
MLAQFSSFGIISRRVLLISSVGFLLAGCVSTQAFRAREEANLLRRAAFDLNCPQTQVRVVDYDTLTGFAGVTGCEHRASYVQVPGTHQWVMDAIDQVPPPRKPPE